MSLRQSIYTGLAQPEVNTKGLSSKNSTAFTSSSILAVVSAMKALSAKCMGGADFNSSPARARMSRRLLGGRKMRAKTAMLAATVALASVVAYLPDAQAQGASGMTFRCTGTDGKRYYGSTVPQACYGRPVEQLNRQGMVVRRIDPEGDEKQRAAKEAEAVSKRQREIASRESLRRDRA